MSKKPCRVIVSLIAGMVALLLTVQVHAESDNNSQFLAAFSGFDHVSTDPRCPQLASTILASGVASAPFGKVSIEMHDCFSPAGPPFVFNSGQFTLTAADGTLVGTYSGQLILLPLSSQTGIFGIDATYTVTGGTGKYAGATGSGRAAGTDNIFTGQTYLVLKGTVKF